MPFLSTIVIVAYVIEAVMVCAVLLLIFDFVFYYYEDKIPFARTRALWVSIQGYVVKWFRFLVELVKDVIRNSLALLAEKRNKQTSDDAKARLRKQKEEAAHEGFFEDSYVRGFHVDGSLLHRGIKAPTARALEYYRVMDELADTQIFENTKEL